MTDLLNDPFVILGLAGISSAIGRCGPLITRRPGVAGFSLGMLFYWATFILPRLAWVALAWLLAPLLLDTDIPLESLFVIVALGSAPLLLAFLHFAPHVSVVVLGGLYVWSFFRIVLATGPAYGIAFLPAMVWLGFSWLIVITGCRALRLGEAALSARFGLHIFDPVKGMTPREVLASLPEPAARLS
jgi:hypothetical protein